MVRARVRVPLNVYLNSRLVGKLRRESSGAIDFTYEQSWLEWPSAFPVSVSLPLREQQFSFWHFEALNGFWTGERADAIAAI